MSGGKACRCERSQDRASWLVTARRCNFSAFNGYRRTPSAWSEIRCVEELGGCGERWRTKAAYVDQLPDG